MELEIEDILGSELKLTIKRPDKDEQVRLLEMLLNGLLSEADAFADGVIGSASLLKGGYDADLGREMQKWGEQFKDRVEVYREALKR